MSRYRRREWDESRGVVYLPARVLTDQGLINQAGSGLTSSYRRHRTPGPTAARTCRQPGVRGGRPRRSARGGVPSCRPTAARRRRDLTGRAWQPPPGRRSAGGQPGRRRASSLDKWPLLAIFQELRHAVHSDRTSAARCFIEIVQIGSTIPVVSSRNTGVAEPSNVVAQLL